MFNLNTSLAEISLLLVYFWCSQPNWTKAIVLSTRVQRRTHLISPPSLLFSRENNPDSLGCYSEGWLFFLFPVASSWLHPGQPVAALLPTHPGIRGDCHRHSLPWLAQVSGLVPAKDRLTPTSFPFSPSPFGGEGGPCWYTAFICLFLRLLTTSLLLLCLSGTPTPTLSLLPPIPVSTTYGLGLELPSVHFPPMTWVPPFLPHPEPI